jgi:hypothetical protein
MENPASFLWIFVLLGGLRLPFLLYRRQQVRNNPARQAAGTQDITFRATILLRFKNPGRLLLWTPPIMTAVPAVPGGLPLQAGDRARRRPDDPNGAPGHPRRPDDGSERLGGFVH